MINFLLMIRPINSLLASIGVVTGYVLVSNPYTFTVTGQLLLLSGAAFLITAYGNVINDIADIDIDKINRPNRPLPSGMVTIEGAHNFSFLLLLIGFSLARAVSLHYFLTTLCIAFLLWIYSFYLKGTVIWGNLVVALLSTVTLLYGALLSVTAVTHVIWPSIFALIIHFCREIVKDIADVEGDKSAGILTFPIVYGVNRALLIVVLFMLLLTFLIPLPWLTERYSLRYLLIAAPIILAATIYSIFLLLTYTKNIKNRCDILSTILKVVLIGRIISVIVGS